MFINAVTTDTPAMGVCVSVFAIFIYVDVKVRGQHLVLFSDNILLGFFFFFFEIELVTGLWDFLIQSGPWTSNTWSCTYLYLLALRWQAFDTMPGIFLHAFWGSNQVLVQAWQVLYQQSHLLRASQLCSFSIDKWKTLLYIKQKKNSTEKRLLLIPVENVESRVLNMWASKWEGKQHWDFPMEI